MTARDRAIEKWSRGKAIVAWMLRNGFVPITREDYLDFACAPDGWSEPLHPEIECEIPDFLRDTG
jgi:hypothetical protein